MAIDQVSEDSDLSTNFPFTIKHMMCISRRFIGSESSVVSGFLRVLRSALTVTGVQSAASTPHRSDGRNQP